MITIDTVVMAKYYNEYAAGKIEMAYDKDNIAQITKWELATPKPELKDYLNDPIVLAYKTKEEKDKINKPIYDALLALDLKSIRGLREGNKSKTDAIELEAKALREKLI